jgi:hypothetical protein
MLVQILLKSVELFKSYDLLGERKSGRYLFFGKMLKKKGFWIKIYFFHYLVGYHALLYSIIT